MTPPFLFFKKIFLKYYELVLQLPDRLDYKVFLFYVGYSNAEEKPEQTGQGIQGNYQF